MRYNIKYTTIILLMLFIFNLYAIEDMTSDSSKPSEDQNKKHFIFSFYFKEKLTYEGNYYETDIFDFKNIINFNFNFPINKSYTFAFWLNDIFLIDFNQLIISDTYGITDPMSTAGNMLYNSINIGIDNKIKIKRIMDFFFDFEFSINTPFNDYFSLMINPLIGLQGSYYFGFFWEIEESVLIEFFPTGYQYEIDILNYSKIGYEFFRFYGPRNYRLSIILENTSNISFFLPYNVITSEIEFKAGISMIFYGVSPFVFFLLKTEKDLSLNYYERISPGINFGVIYTNKIFNAHLEYSGTYNTTALTKAWTSRIDFYLKLQIYK